MKRHLRLTKTATTMLVLVCLTVPAAAGRDPGPASVASDESSVVIQWNKALLDCVRGTNFRPMWTARALAIVHTAMYDAWAAYDWRAVGLHWDRNLRRPRQERSIENKQVAVSYAAYRTLADLFPSQAAARLDPVMAALGLDPQDASLDPESAVGIGNLAAGAVIAFRHRDGANQLGDENGGAPYSDYTGYTPVNTPDLLVDPNRWQPLRDANGVVQQFLAPHWRMVRPFALTAPDQFLPADPALFPDQRYTNQAEALIRTSAGLTDRDKAIAEYWADGPSTETPPGHWSLLAQFVSRRDRHTLDDDVKMYFALGNALLDASIAVWDCKVQFDYVRPVTAVRFLYQGTLIEAWGGPFQGTKHIDGSQFRSYIATPPFAEYTSGHSAFSAASAAVLRLFTGSRRFGASHTFRAGTSTIEPGLVPSQDVVLSWQTFDEAAEEAGRSRRLGGIHFRDGDLVSREIGTRIGRQAWLKAKALILGARP